MSENKSLISFYLQYVGGSDHTVPWDEAPTAVADAMALIRQRIYAALSKEYNFNEILSCGYMEKQKMSVSVFFFDVALNHRLTMRQVSQ